jgi:hypothetical protein
MPYISKEDRIPLDPIVDIATGILEKKPLEESLGDLNYLFSRIIAGAIGKTSYRKIAMATGVLENVKQELYRRLATPYEEEKITRNGDIREYDLQKPPGSP